jgi:hypothetical protein
MKSDIARFEREIAVERADLLANLALLEDRARAVTDWRRQVRRHPLAAVGAAAAGGLLLAMLTEGQPRSAAARDADGHGDQRARPRGNPIIERIVSALAVVAAERVFAAIGVAMPTLDDAPRAARAPRTPVNDGP